jgi:hypothetical protein
MICPIGMPPPDTNTDMAPRLDDPEPETSAETSAEEFGEEE